MFKNSGTSGIPNENLRFDISYRYQFLKYLRSLGVSYWKAMSKVTKKSVVTISIIFKVPVFSCYWEPHKTFPLERKWIHCKFELKICRVKSRQMLFTCCINRSMEGNWRWSNGSWFSLSWPRRSYSEMEWTPRVMLHSTRLASCSQGSSCSSWLSTSSRKAIWSGSLDSSALAATRLRNPELLPVSAAK